MVILLPPILHGTGAGCNPGIATKIAPAFHALAVSIFFKQTISGDEARAPPHLLFESFPDQDVIMYRKGGSNPALKPVTNNMKILVTGGSGFIGSHVVEHYQNRAEVIVLDDLRTGHRKNLDGLKCRFVEGSILDRALVDEVMGGVDYVVHLAALVSVPESMSLPGETVNINVHGLLNVLESARRHGVKKLCFASSAAVYGENPAQPKVESMAPDPRSPYAITKLDGEYYCGLYAREGWLATACLRFFNVFGPRQDPNSAYAAAVPIFLRRARDHEPITIYGDGGQTRDFIYVKDIVGALAFAAETPEASGVFNAGYGSTLSIGGLVREILDLTGSRSEVRHEPVRAGDIRHSTSDPSKLMALGWKPGFDVASGLRRMI